MVMLYQILIYICISVNEVFAKRIWNFIYDVDL